MVLVLMACHLSTVYSHYEHVPVSGWERNDTLTFCIKPLKQEGTYREDIGIRINGTFPFMGLTLIINQQVFPSLESRKDTLSFDLVGEDGNAKGQGVNHYQYTLPLTMLTLNEGDSLCVRIRHDMKREILPGITDIGVSLTHLGANEIPTRIDAQENKQ